MTVRGRKKTRPALPALEWLEDAAGAHARVLILGAKAMVENHQGIVEFTENRVRLQTRDGIVAFEGENLSLEDIRPGALTVRGALSMVQLPGRKGGADDAR